ncbi:MAG: DUF2267 domain-containing protein [Armatimonadota bacterium]
MTMKQLLSRVMQIPGVNTEEHAEHVVAAVFQALRDRLTPGEADDVWAQLPSEWKDLWESGSWWEKITARLRGMNHLDREAFIARVQVHIKHEINAEHAVRVVFHALKEQISVGEVNDVASQLPTDLRQVWKAA